jgi:murein L,D-transpeptidase YafK
MNLSFNYRKPLLAWFLLGMWCSGFAVPGDSERPWVLVDTEKLTLSLMHGERTELLMEDIAIGRNGTTRAKRQGDDRTPLGEFRISWINWDSRFHRFIGLDYPNLEHGRRGLEAGRISDKQWREIEKAQSEREPPPQNTPLGGQIGLHGIGEGDPKVHRDFNWTHGCVALTNEQIDRLLQQVGLGTRVVIR